MHGPVKAYRAAGVPQLGERRRPPRRARCRAAAGRPPRAGSVRARGRSSDSGARLGPRRGGGRAPVRVGSRPARAARAAVEDDAAAERAGRRDRRTTNGRRRGRSAGARGAAASVRLAIARCARRLARAVVDLHALPGTSASPRSSATSRTMRAAGPRPRSTRRRPRADASTRTPRGSPRRAARPPPVHGRRRAPGRCARVRAAAGQQGDAVAGAERARPERPGDDRAGAVHRERAVDVEHGRAVGVRAPRHARGDMRRSRRGPARRRSPARVEQSTIGTSSSTSARTSSRGARGSARSAFVIATTPRARRARAARRRARASAASPRRRRRPRAGRGRRRWRPATIVRTKRSWPGTSTSDSRRAAEESSCAKPRSIDMPRALLLRQPVGVAPGERADERGLAVVDVAGGADRERQVAAHGRGRPRDGAAKESNLPTAGLPRLPGFEGRLGHRARAAPRLRLMIHGSR